MAECFWVYFICLETNDFGCLWMNWCLCQGANRPNQSLPMEKHDEPTKSSTILAFGSSRDQG